MQNILESPDETISVIIPVYNAEVYIANTVDVINAATVKPFEIVLVNDGSTDSSLEKCWALKNRYSNVKVIDKANGGVAEARNIGIENSKGNYICFVDQDDFVDASMYGKVQERLRDTDADVAIVSTGQIVKGKKIPYEHFDDSLYSGNEVQEKLLKAFLYRGYKEPVRENAPAVSSSIWKCVIKRTLLDAHSLRFRRFISYEDDYIMMASLLCYAKKIVTMEYIGYYWLVNDASESHSAKYISDYGEKTKQLYEYMTNILADSGLSKQDLHIFQDQLVFEKTIDVVENAFSSQNHASYKQKTKEVKLYLELMNFFDRNSENIEPLTEFHRLKLLYKSYKKRNSSRLILWTVFFLCIEKLIHKSHSVMRLLNTHK